MVQENNSRLNLFKPIPKHYAKTIPKSTFSKDEREETKRNSDKVFPITKFNQNKAAGSLL
jgi:hypothetical protein